MPVLTLRAIPGWLHDLAHWLDRDPRRHFAVFATVWVFSVLAGIPLLILMLAGFYRFEALGMSKPRSWPRQLGIGLALGAGVYLVRAAILAPFAFWIGAVVGGEGGRTPTEIVYGNPSAYLKQIVLGIVNAGFYEEFLFRGYLLNRTAAYLVGHRFRWTFSVTAVAVLFGLLHFHLGTSGMVFAFAWFIVSCLVYFAIGRNLWPMMVGHAFSDITTFTLAYLGWLPKVSWFASRLWFTG